MVLFIIILVAVAVIGSLGHGGKHYRRRRRAGLTVRESIPFGRHGRISVSEHFGGGRDEY
jgi:hypothetical protein